MLIKKIKFKNFRQFYGEVNINLDITENKNVVIIHAENGVGKTAFLNAIKWAFFEQLTSNFRNPTNLLNEVAKKKGEHACRVEIEFEEDGKIFLLQRRYDQNTKKSILKIFALNDSVWGDSLPEPELVINSMLPKEMGDYFFFQGEGSNAVDTGNNQGNLAKSIRDILGFKVAESLQASLKINSNSTRRAIAEQDNTGKSSQLNKSIEDDEKELFIQKQRKIQANITIAELESKLENLELKLSQINNQNLQELRNKERSASIQLTSLKSDKLTKEKRKYESISKFGWAVFGAEFAELSLDFIDEAQLKGKLPEPYNKTFIEDILSEAKCICGSTLEVGSEGFKHITAMLGKAANPQLMQRLTGIRAQIQDINTLNSVAEESIANIIDSYDTCDERIQSLELKLKNLEEKITSIPEDKINALHTSKLNLKSDLKDQMKLLATSEVKIEFLEKELKKNINELESSASNNELIDALKIKENFVNDLYEFLKKYLAETEQKICMHVLQEVNKTLQEFSRHDFHITVSESFRFYLKDKEGNNVGQGDGLNLLLNLTITAALINFAADRRNVKDPILNSSTVAPLIIDAPFGVLDKKYRKVVISELPKYANQVIFLVSSSQWTEDMDSEIRGSINKEYVMILEESSLQGSKELDRVMINGTEVITSRYGCDIDRTLISEVD